MLIMCCCDGNKGNNNSYTSSNPFVGEWVGVHIDKTSGVYSNETVVRKYHISIYKDGTCIITESSTGEHSYIKKYEGEWKLENGSFANQRFEWIYLSGSDRITNWATNLFMTKDGNIYFPYANNGLDRIRQGNPDFKLRKDNTIEDKRASSHSNTSNYEWINGKWFVNTREMGLVTLVIRADNTLMMNNFEGRFEIEDDIMYCYFETENIRLPLNKTNQTIDFGKGYILRKEAGYFNSDNPNHEIKEDDEIDESHYIIDE